MKKLPFTYFVTQTVLNEKINSKPKIKYFNIINESIFKKNYFTLLFQQIKSINCFRSLSLNEICNYFPLNWKIRLNLLNGSNKKSLLVFNIQYKKEILLEAISFLINDYLKIPNIYQKDLKQELFNQLITSNSTGCYFAITGITKYGILFLNKDKITDEIFIHEFIHYYQDVTGKDVNDFKLNFNQLEIPNNLNLFLYFKNNSQLIEYLNIIAHSNELIPYINNLIFQLQDYLKNKSQIEIQKDLNILFMSSLDSTNENYIDRLYKSDFCQYLIKNKLSLIPLLLLILCNLYEKNLKTFREHLFTAF